MESIQKTLSLLELALGELDAMRFEGGEMNETQSSIGESSRI
jgi:hypothetical protein